MDGLVWALILGYPILQVITVLKTAKWWRLIAVLPLIPMIYIIVETIKAYNQESNLWPIMYLFSAPVALVYLGIFLAIHKAVRNKE